MKDVSVAVNNFIREEYGAVEPPSSPKILVDGGAYIGDTTAYFLSKYPSLRSIAFEPMPDSFAMAQQNLKPYNDRVELLQMALTADGQPIQMTGEQTGARAGAQGKIEVQTITITQILERLPENRIDILKLDVEGSEGPIFADAPERWLPKVNFIIVETHGDEVTNTVLGALQAANWTIERVRNLYFCSP
jgi:FkbM family methyltransferase